MQIQSFELFYIFRVRLIVCYSCTVCEHTFSLSHSQGQIVQHVFVNWLSTSESEFFNIQRLYENYPTYNKNEIKIVFNFLFRLSGILFIFVNKVVKLDLDFNCDKKYTWKLIQFMIKSNQFQI